MSADDARESLAEKAIRAARQSHTTVTASVSDLYRDEIKAISAMQRANAEKEESQMASGFHKRLVKWINDFDSKLDATEEVGVRLVNFGSVVSFHLRDIYYANPYLIGFVGETEDGQSVELIQHVSQISILLMKFPRKNPEEPKRKLGF